MDLRDSIIPVYRNILEIVFFAFLLIPLFVLLIFHLQVYFKKKPQAEDGSIRQVLQKIPQSLSRIIKGKKLPDALKEYVFDLGEYPGMGKRNMHDFLGRDPAKNYLLKKIQSPNGKKFFGPYIKDIEKSYRDEHGNYFKIFSVGNEVSTGLFVVSCGPNGRLDIPELKVITGDIAMIKDWPKFTVIGDDKLFIIKK
ncbi:hypothetical protein ACFL35_16765 [Candidatus Riflebacteria bacterium]